MFGSVRAVDHVTFRKRMSPPFHHAVEVGLVALRDLETSVPG